MTVSTSAPWNGEDQALISGGSSMTFIIQSDGTLLSGGSNLSGELGIGEDTWAPMPMNW